MGEKDVDVFYVFLYLLRKEKNEYDAPEEEKERVYKQLLYMLANK